MFPQSDEMALIGRRNRQSICLVVAAGIKLALGCADRGIAETPHRSNCTNARWIAIVLMRLTFGIALVFVFVSLRCA